MIPRATYRIQFHKDFPFSAAAVLAPYLRDLGISHLYASPILTARSGSNHGYDVVDCTRINPELGGEAAFRSLAKMLRDHDIGIILDIVPNHMAVGGADNPMWLDLLENGRASRYAQWFDVDFDTETPGLSGKILAPFLGSPYEDVLRGGEIKLVHDEALGKFVATYFHHRFPIRPEDQDEIGRQGLEAFGDPDALHSLLERQNFRLAWWRTAGDIINYRRFFDVTELAAIRMDSSDAFEAVHKIAFELYAEGLIDGVRVDHIDGLADPTAYCLVLRERLAELQSKRSGKLSEQAAYIIVEKILAADEPMPGAWPVEGTSGYDFMNEVSALQHNESGEALLESFWADVSERHLSFEDEEIAAREQMLRVNFYGQSENLADTFFLLAAKMGDSRDLSRGAISRALTALIKHFRVYRSYATGKPDSPGAGEAIDIALTHAKAEPASETAALDFVLQVLNDKGGDLDLIRAIRRFHHLTAPVAAKAVEDTAFYRYGRLISRNDVGFDAARLAMTAEEFHQRMTRRSDVLPNSMLATATHDHKRGEDVRARLVVLSEMPVKWQAQCVQWFEMNASIRPALADKGDEYQLYQMIAGAWPLDLHANDPVALAEFRDRLAGWREKSMREAKLRSTWLAPDVEAEAAAQTFLSALLDPDRSSAFLGSMKDFVNSIAAAGASNSLVQLALRCLAPGVPDTYQGTELWDFSLVDPDNRRAVDFDARRQILNYAGDVAVCAANWHDGSIKLRLLQSLLACRAQHPQLFAEGTYVPLIVTGKRSKHVLAFARETASHRLVAAVTLHCAKEMHAGSLTPSSEWWSDTLIQLPHAGSELNSILTSASAPLVADSIPAGQAFRTLPVAVWRTVKQSES